MNKQIYFPLLLVSSFLWLFGSCYQKGEQAPVERTLPVGKIFLSDAQMQLANIKVCPVKNEVIGSHLLLTGVLKVNEQNVVNITSRSAGRIQKLFFKNTGDQVKQGDSLYQFYSEELVAAEREFFTLQHNNWNATGRYEPSLVLENKLLYLGMLPDQVVQLKKEGKILLSVTILSPVEGTIRFINVTENEYVEAGKVLFELADHENLWVEAQAYPGDLPLLKTGLPSLITFPAAGNKTIKSSVSFISPTHEQGTNATLIRADIDNSDHSLYPGMLARMDICLLENNGIVIPSSAVIMDKKGSHIWVRNEDGSFSCTDVITGTQSEDSVLIVSGLDHGQNVVTSGVYLLHSELILKNGPAIEPPREMTATQSLEKDLVIDRSAE